MKNNNVALLIILIIFTFVTVGCSRQNHYVGMYQTSSDGNPIRVFEKKNLRYKIEFIDIRQFSKQKSDILLKRETIKSFAEYLGNKAIIVDIIEKTSFKRELFSKYQEEMSTTFDMEKDSPFLIFYKSPSLFSSKFKKYKILSIASVTQEELKELLSVLRTSIIQGKSDTEIIRIMEDTKILKSFSYKTLVKLIQELIYL